MSQKSVLLRAWRERWPDTQWSIHAQRLYTPPHQLSELLFQQAFSGTSPNMLVLSYLRHAVSTQMVTVTSVIKLILQYEDIGKIFCTRALLDLVENLCKRLCISASYEDSLQVARDSGAMLLWLLQLSATALSRLSDDKMSNEYAALVEKVATIFEVMRSHGETMGMLCVARHDEEGKYEEMKAVHGKMIANLSKTTLLNAEINKKMKQALQIVIEIDQVDLQTSAILDASHQNLNASLNVLLNIEAVLHSTNSIPPFVEQILIIETTQGIERCMLYCELLRTSLAGMIDAASGTEELRWAAFTFLKMPQVLVELLHKDPNKEHSLDHLLRGFDLLLNYVPLLDLTDTKCGADCLHFLLNEVCNKHALLTDAQCQALIKRRQTESRKVSRSNEQQNTQPSASLILRAEHTVTSILKTLDADYSKNQDALLGVLCHMMSGKSFELILAAAAATGKLQSFAIKLIKFNEFSKQTAGEAGKDAQTRFFLFDISFLMLCHFTQLYGNEIVCGHPDSQHSFFLQWATRCLPESGKYKSPALFPAADPAKLDILLTQFNPGVELKISQTRWQDVCHTAPHAIQEVLNAWQYGTLNEQQVKSIVENVKSHMCCLPVVISAYLCSVSSLLADADRAKCQSVLSWLRATPGATPDATAAATANDYYTERSHLMQMIVSKIVSGLLPSGGTTDHTSDMPTNMPALTMLRQTLRQVLQTGAVSISHTHRFDQLLQLSGPNWFSSHLVTEVLADEQPEELYRAVGVAYALLNLDVDALVLSLVQYTVPTLLQKTGTSVKQLTDPRGIALAKLTVLSLLLMRQQSSNIDNSGPMKRGRKRTYSEIAFEDNDVAMDEELEEPLAKRLASSHPFPFPDSFQYADKTPPKEETGEKSSVRDPLGRALMKLFRLMSAVLSSGKLSQRIGFVVSFVEEVLKSGLDNARYILQFMPLSMVPLLMKFMSNDSTVLLILCDLKTISGRKLATKVLCQMAKWPTRSVAA